MSPTSAPETARRAIHASQAHASKEMAADHSMPAPAVQHAPKTTAGPPIATTIPTARSRASAGAPRPARANAAQTGQHHSTRTLKIFGATSTMFDPHTCSMVVHRPDQKAYDTLAASTATLNATLLPRLSRTSDDTARTVRQFGHLAEGLAEQPQSLLLGRGAAAPGPGESGFTAPAGKAAEQ